jgi:selenocysteine lyase/cysteine desulfurase
MSLKTDLFSNRLAHHYTKFDVANRLLFTGHSHQAWPDVALDGMIEAFDVAASKVDTKWDTVFQKISVMSDYLKQFYDDPDGHYTHCENTHHLIVRWLSALDLRSKPRVVTTDTEFYSLYRQLTRLEEEGIEIVFVPALPLEGFAARMEAVLDEKTAAVMLSRVYFEHSLINIELPQVAKLCKEHGIPLMIDDYHGTNVVPISVRESGLEDAFVLIGGYKYMQWGEGNCFLRSPAKCEMRPIVTGWFSAFSSLKQPRSKQVNYDEGAWRFYGATFDGTSAFRGAAVTEFFSREGLSPKLLQKMYAEHVAYMKYAFLKLDMDPQVIRLAHNYSLKYNAGFLALRSPIAIRLFEELKTEGVLTDCRGEILRFGSAPYMTSRQIDRAFEILATIVKKEQKV